MGHLHADNHVRIFLSYSRAQFYFAESLAHGLACLILDGPLSIKLPNAAREAHIEGVFGALASMVEGRMKAPAHADKRSAKSSKPGASKRKTAKRG